MTLEEQATQQLRAQRLARARQVLQKVLGLNVPESALELHRDSAIHRRGTCHLQIANLDHPNNTCLLLSHNCPDCGKYGFWNWSNKLYNQLDYAAALEQRKPCLGCYLKRRLGQVRRSLGLPIPASPPHDQPPTQDA